MSERIQRLIDKKGEASGTDLTRALLRDHLEKAAYCVRSLIRDHLASDPNTAFAADYWDRWEEADSMDEYCFWPRELKDVQQITGEWERFLKKQVESYAKRDLKVATELIKQDLERQFKPRSDLDF